MLAALSPQRRRLFFATGGLILAVVIAAALVVVVRATSGSAGPVPQNQPGPVLLVPGYGGNVDSLAPLAAALRSTGRDVVVVDLVGDGTGDLRAQARHLGQVAEGVMTRTGAPSVDVVGYSAGGVVARLWVRDEDGATVARRVLTIGSPQHGTNEAALGLELAGGCPTACEQLVPDSDLLRTLNAGDETPDGPLWATIRSSTDSVVTPTGSAALTGAVNIIVQDVCKGATTTHGALPGDPVVIAALGSVLGVPPPRLPAGVSC